MGGPLPPQLPQESALFQAHSPKTTLSCFQLKGRGWLWVLGTWKTGAPGGSKLPLTLVLSACAVSRSQWLSPLSSPNTRPKPCCPAPTGHALQPLSSREFWAGSCLHVILTIQRLGRASLRSDPKGLALIFLLFQG